ncbi:unnamed protein product [Rotaria sp. Silwood2]|nr:unnamed protein product [Rotaria sp. Silwood2]
MIYVRYPFDPPNAVSLVKPEEIHLQTTMADTDEERDDQSCFSMTKKLAASHSGPSVRPVTRKPTEHLLELLRDKWELPPPELIISVTGSAKIFNLTARNRVALQKGLVSAAVTTDAWVFTGGTHAGVMKDVGDAFEKWAYKSSGIDKTHARVPVIGIASWYYTTNYKQLIQKRFTERNSGRRPTSISLDDIETNCEKLYRYHAPQDEPQSYPLDPNHTHFILLDDTWGEDDEKWQRNKCNVRADLTIQLRAEIEQEARCSSHYRQSN